MIAISTSVIVFVLFVVPALGFALYLWLHDTLVRIDAGEVGLVEVRGQPTDRVLLPGTHLVVPFGRMTIHPYPTRELVFRTSRDARSDDDDDPTTDPPIGVVLGDRSHAEVSFTVRFRLDVDQLRDIHLRIGPSGIFDLVRDVSERQLGDSLADSSITYDDVFGTQRVTLEARLQDDLTGVLAEHGIVVTFFGLREIDLGEIGVAVQAAARARALAEQETVTAEVRRVRAEHDVEVAHLVDGLSDAALSYHRIQVWRGLIDRWDGRIAIPDTSPNGAGPSSSEDVATR
ncbi:MAG TPA: SPFH domain-containing protein [Ilumatobacteraceae bacterium]|nr:SPFH domain-containing protein [Ilumatobacteraceae bacterium]